MAYNIIRYLYRSTTVNFSVCFKHIIILGSRYVYDFNADTYGTHSLVIHHRYNETQNFACDIALVFLERPMRFSKNMKKGILASNAKWMNRREFNFTVTGWGWTKVR